MRYSEPDIALIAHCRADIILRKVSLSRCVGVAATANQHRRSAEVGGTELLIDVGGRSL